MVKWINKIKEYLIERKKKKLFKSCENYINEYYDFLHKTQKKRNIDGFDDCLEHNTQIVTQITNLFTPQPFNSIIKRSILHNAGELSSLFVSFAYGQSMQPEISAGDIVISGFPKKIKKGDIISSMNGCHRVIEVLEKEIEGERKIFYKTKGDNNEEEDPYIPDFLVSSKIVKIIKRDSDLYNLFYDFLTK